MWSGSFFVLPIAGMVVAVACLKRAEVGRAASTLAGLAVALMVFNYIVIAGASGFANERVDDWTELGQRVPPGWRHARDLLAAIAPVLSSAALALLAAAVLALLAVKAEPGKRTRAR